MVVPTLPIDVLLVVLRYLHVPEILQLRQTCKDFRAITQTRSLWFSLLQNEIVRKRIPIPGLKRRGLEDLPAEELERLFFNSLRLHRNWTSRAPVALHSSAFTVTDDPRAQVVSLTFLPGMGGRWLISLALTPKPQGRLFSLQCWSLSEHPNCVAQRTFTDLRGLRINTDPGHPGMLAVGSSLGIEILSVDFAAEDPELGFALVQVLDQVTESPFAFTGSTLLTRFGDNQLHLRTLENPYFVVELSNPAYVQQSECLDALLCDGYALVTRTETLEIYLLSSFRAQESGDRILEPISSHVWQWKLDSASMVFRAGPASHWPRPVDLLVRFSSLFPWPVNALHHYHLDSPRLLPTAYVAQPTLTRTLASPVRLFARFDMCLGPFGTALWMDSHTEDYFDHAIEGQRLAGTLISHHVTEGYSGTCAVFHAQEHDTWVRIGMLEEEGKIALATTSAEVKVYEYC
ncbi:unnamed protein product [Mycena citricolor]|uniref:F-box domain-containing protein n=1 Tax=Mycena citricolor TaxID=2018698 RepID=A0AAD2HFC7_9AGAR|nr:unnamed protein product [Mycena citricolor]